MTFFQYHSDIIARYPDLVGGVLVARNLQNTETPGALVNQYLAEQQKTITRIGSASLSELPTLAAWRSAFRAFGVDPTQYRCAAEALLRRLTKKGDIPSINMLVDIGNMVSIRYGLPVAVLDLAGIEGGITVHFSDGSEVFTNLGQAEADHPQPGEVIFTDENKAVVARRWCWRQSDQSAARLATTNVMITVEAHHCEGQADVTAAVNDVAALLTTYTGAQLQTGILDKSKHMFTAS